MAHTGGLHTVIIVTFSIYDTTLVIPPMPSTKRDTCCDGEQVRQPGGLYY